MELVQAFNAELSTLYEVKPPISKAKMSVITKTAIKAIKMYKHIVQSVERFIAKCRPEYKVPGLYVVDSIVRQSRHQFGYDKDVFGPRFTRNFQQTFQNLFLTCPVEDKPKIVRVLNLWQRNNVFSCDVIQPLLDMANPNAELKSLSPSDELKDNNQDSNIVLSLQQLATSLAKNNSNGQQLNSSTSSNQPDNQIRFNKKLLDFNYSDDDDDLMKGDTPTENEQPLSTSLNISNSDDLNTNSLAFSMAQNLLSNPDLVQKLQQSIAMQSTTDQNSKMIDNLDNITSSSFFNSINQTILNNSNNDITEKLFNLRDSLKLVQQNSNQQDQFDNKQKDKLRRSISPNRRDKYNNNSKHNSLSSRRDQERSSYRDNDRDRRRSDRRSSRERGRRSRSPKITSSSSSQNRKESSFLNLSSSNYQQPSTSVLSPESKERERENERRKKGLPPIKKNYLTICSTTLWLGHLPKSTTEIDISDAFGEYGTINTIDLISARGCAYVCMNRRQDAYKALQNLKNSGNLKLHNKNLKMAWSPGKGMKGKEYKEYWDVDLGVSYIPYDKINRETDFELLEDGGMIDEESMSSTLVELRNKKLNEEKEQKKLNELNAAQLETSIVNTSTVNSLTTTGITIQPPIPPSKSITSAAQIMPPFVPMPNMPFNPLSLPPGIMNLPPPLPHLPNLGPLMTHPPHLPPPIMPHILPVQPPPANLINNQKSSLNELEKKQTKDSLPVNSNQNTPNKSQKPPNMFHQPISLPNNHQQNNSINPWSSGMPPPFLAPKDDQPPPHQFFGPTNDDLNLNFSQSLFEQNLLLNPQINPQLNGPPPMILPPFQDDSLHNPQFSNDKRDLKFNNRDNWRRKDQQRNNNRNNRFNNNLNNNYSSNNDDNHRQNNKRKRNDNYNNLNNLNNKNNNKNKKKFNNNNNNKNMNKQQNNQQNRKQNFKNKNEQQQSENNDDKSINELNDNKNSWQDNSINDNELIKSNNDSVNEEVNNVSFDEENNFNDKSSNNQFDNESNNLNNNNSINLNEEMATET